jgi:DNA-binding XRE family transcriptional regulator
MRGASQVELAAEAGISQQAIALLECDPRRESSLTWKRLAVALDVAELLFTGGHNEH